MNEDLREAAVRYQQGLERKGMCDGYSLYGTPQVQDAFKAGVNWGQRSKVWEEHELVTWECKECEFRSCRCVADQQVGAPRCHMPDPKWVKVK